MSFIHEPKDCGLAIRWWRIYREKRRDQHPRSPRSFRMPRWAAAQVAWRQARAAQAVSRGRG